MVCASPAATGSAGSAAIASEKRSVCADDSGETDHGGLAKVHVSQPGTSVRDIGGLDARGCFEAVDLQFALF